MDVGFEVSRDARELLVRGDVFLRQLAFAEDLLRLFLVLPEIGAGTFLF
jgi:hypothetical protein